MKIVKLARRSARLTTDALWRGYYGLRIYSGYNDRLRLELNFPKLGLFAHLNVVAGLAYRLKNRRTRFSVECVTRNYSAGRGDWFNELFVDQDPVSLSEATRCIRIPCHARFPGCYRNERLTLESARDAFFSKFAIRPELTSAADDFARQHFGDRRILGVHYRGTDKIAEAPRVKYDAITREIMKKLATGAFAKIFVATDEEQFVEYLLASTACEVVVQQSVARSRSAAPVHLREDADGLFRAKQAMIDVQLLARCHTLIKTASALSGWAVLMNPGIEVEYVNRPLASTNCFPDTLLLERLDMRSAAG